MFKLKPFYYCCMGAFYSLFAITNAQAAQYITPTGVSVSQDVKHDVSLPLRYMQGKSNLMTRHYPPTPLKKIVNDLANPIRPESSLLIPLSGFQGLGVGLGDYQVTDIQADTNGSVGMTQYVQFVNSDLAVFDKSSGNLVSGFPKPASSLWAGFGGLCETKAAGFVTIKYDQLAHRWMLSQYASDNFNTGPFFHCVAISTSEDATGTYHRYAFQLNSFSNFARSALWSDAYYFGFNMIGRISDGPQMCALERDKMLAGLPASIQCKQLTNLQSGELLPADLEGESLPPTGNPEYFLGLTNINNLTLYKFHVDFVNPNQTTINNINIPVEMYVRACNGTQGMACAIQPNTLNRLNIASSSITRVIYRQFADYGSMVAVHTIEGSQPKYAPAIRWYELRVARTSPNFNPTVYQQATLAPDSKNRFSGSISIDKAGGIAVGYNVTSSLIFPSIELASRIASDPLRSLAIQPLVTGRGSQINSITNWSATSKMAIDPTDNCTFWFNNAYLKTTGFLNWSTFIMKFKLAGCQ